MVRMITCVCLYLAIVASSFKVVSADETKNLNRNAIVETYISSFYEQINFGQADRLPYDAFDKAYRGYLNLREAGRLNTDKAVISVCDFNLPSTAKRLWVIDLVNKKVLFNTLVAHGEGSGMDSAYSFSNKENSHQSSLGFYVTSDTYKGDHGLSLRLDGMDVGFNDAARDRDIVVHGAQYVCNKFVCTNQRLGRSWGCPAVPQNLSQPIINAIKDGTCLFIYYPDNNYLSNAYWVNKPVSHLPEQDILSGLQDQDTAK